MALEAGTKLGPYAAAGETDDARKVLEVLEVVSKKDFVPAYYVAATHLRLGDECSAIRGLEQAYENRENWLAYLRIDPIFDGLRSMEEFRALLEKIGLG